MNDDPELARIFAALKGEPPPPERFRVRRTPWATRLMRNAWQRPYPYLFHRWEVISLDRPADFVASGSKRAVGRWMEARERAAWAEYMRQVPPQSHGEGSFERIGPRIPVPWKVHAKHYRSHRCPVCNSYPALRVLGRPSLAVTLRVYTCTEGEERCGQRYARRPWLPSYPGNGDRPAPLRHLRQWRWLNYGLPHGWPLCRLGIHYPHPGATYTGRRYCRHCYAKR